MAYLPASQREDQDQGNPQTGTEQVVSGGGSVIGSGAAGAAPPAAGGAPGGYTNLQQYLGANAGSNSAKLGSDISDAADSKVSAARTDLANAQSDFSGQVQGNTVQTDQGLLGKVKEGPEQVVNDPTSLDQFTKMRTANYQGPQDLTNSTGYDAALKDYDGAGQYVNATKDEYGRQGLLNQTYSGTQRQSGNGPAYQSYSNGENTLDNFLLGQSEEGQQAVKGIQNRYANIGNEVGEANTAAQQQAQQAAATTEATRAAAQGALDEATTGLQTGLDQRVAAANASRQKDYQQQQQALASDPRYAQAGIDYKPFLQQGLAATRANTATDADRSRYSSLLQLAGGQSPTLFDPSQKAPLNSAVSLNQQGLQGTEKAAMDQLTASYQQQIAQQNVARQQAYQQALAQKQMQYGADAAGASRGFDPTQFVKQGANVNLSNLISEPDLTKYNALASLLGLQGIQKQATVDPFAVNNPAISTWMKGYDQAHQPVAAPQSAPSPSGGHALTVGTPLNIPQAANTVTDNLKKVRI